VSYGLKDLGNTLSVVLCDIVVSKIFYSSSRYHDVNKKEVSSGLMDFNPNVSPKNIHWTSSAVGIPNSFRPSRSFGDEDSLRESIKHQFRISIVPSNGLVY